MKQRYIRTLIVSATSILLLSLALSVTVFAAAKTVTLFNGALTIVDTAGKGSGSGTSYSASVSGGFSASSSTITLTNASNAKRRLSFEYSITDTGVTGGSHTFGSNSGTIELVMTPGQSISYTITSGKLAKLSVNMSNIVFEEISDTNLTFNYNSNEGSVIVNGDTVSPGGTVSVDPAIVSNIKAVANAGYEFIGWMRNVNGQETYYPISGNHNGQLSEHLTLRAIFAPVSSDIMFWVGNDLYTGWDAALAAVGSSGTMVLANNGTLAAGDYWIPSGVSLLIPYNPAHTLITDNMEEHVYIPYTEYPSLTLYRQLTLETGATITVQEGGIISVGSQAHCQLVGQTGPYGLISMEQGSNITVESGGTLYAWGYVSAIDVQAPGTVTIEDGGSVYENLMVFDYPGSASSALDVKEAGAFPMRAYTMRNVEVPMTLSSGATMKAFYSIYGQSVGYVNGYVPIFGHSSSSAVFAMEDGSWCEVAYINGRQKIRINGNAAVNSLSVTVKVKVVTEIEQKISTSDTSGIPIPSGFDLELTSGTVSFNDNIILGEGSKATIHEGAVLDTNGYRIFFLGSEERGTVTVTDVHGVQFAYVNQPAILDNNGVVKVSGKGGLYVFGDAIVKSSNGTGKIVYNGATGTKDLKMKVQGAEVDTYSTAAILRNDIGAFNVSSGKTYVYDATLNGWRCESHTPGASETCTTAQTCTVCGATIPAKGHTEVVDAAVAPTCTETGLTAGKHCSVCNEVLTAQTIVAAKGHTEVVDAAKAPTCTATGLTEGKHCSVCSAVIVAQTNVDALGHTEGATVVENECDADCTTKGSYENVVYCTVCDEELSRTTVEVEALGHTEVVDEAKAPTCTATGLTEGKHCSVCNEVLVAQEVVAANGHSWEDADCTTPKTCSVCGATEGDARGHDYGDWIVDKEATCTQNGSQYRDCQCGDRETEEIPATGHTEVVDAAKEPTCTETGLTEGKHCSVCGTVTVAQEVVAALGHTAAEAVKENEVAATCGADGSYESVVYCSVCNAEISRTTETVAATGEHVYATETDRKDATCTEDGSVTMACGCGATETTTLSATGHTEAAAVKENEVAADCVNDGSYDNVVYCTVCGEELSRETVEVEALGHTEGEAVTENVVGGTCTTDGSYDTVKYCSVCGEELERETTVNTQAPGHTAAEAVKENEVAADCVNDGSYDNVVYCTVCGEELDRETTVVPASGHTEGDVVVENEVAADCTNDGSYDNVVYCTVCGDELSRETVTVDALPHTEGEAFVDQESKVDATCGADGSYDTVVCCSVCGEELSRVTETVPATGEHYDSDDDEDEDCDVCGNPMDFFNITFVGYYGDEQTVSVMYGKKVPFPELSEELTTTTFVLNFAGWKLQTEDGLVDVDPGVTATGDATYVCNYEIVEAKFPPLMSVEYGSQEENVVMYVQLFVYADTNGLIQPVVEIVKPDTADALVRPLNVVEGRKQTVYMYKIAMTAADISDPNRVIRITLGNYTQEITEAVSKYTDALANAGLIQDQFNTNIPQDVLDAQDVLINEMLAYGNNVQLYFKGNEAVLKPGHTEAFPIIDNTTMKEYETLYNTADPKFIMNTDAVETDFNAATVNFNEVLGLYFFYNVTLKVPGTITEKGIIISNAELSDKVKSEPFDAQEHPDMIYVEAGTNTQTDKVSDAAYMSGADGMTVNDIEDKYITIYVEYEDEDGTHVVYGTYMIYGIRRYVQKQIYKYSPTGKGDTVAAQNEKNPNATKRYVNLLDSILRVNDSAAALEKAKNDAAVAPTE